MMKKAISYKVARESLALREMAKRSSEKGIMLELEASTPVGGRASKRVVMKRVGNNHWKKTTLFKFFGDTREFVLNNYDRREYYNAEYCIALEQQIPLDISSEDEKTILENQKLVIYQSEKVGKQKVVDVRKTLANIAKFKKSKGIELEGVHLMVAREFTKEGYKFLYGWVLEQVNDGSNSPERALPRLLSVEEVSSGEIYQLTDGWESYTISNALSRAVSAFEKRAVANIMKQDIEEIANPDKGVLVYLQDSYSVGSCQSGTDAWLRQMGLSGKLVPLHVIHQAAEESNNNLARNVVKSVVAKYLAENKEVA